jgi:hypothetical protein
MSKDKRFFGESRSAIDDYQIVNLKDCNFTSGSYLPSELHDVILRLYSQHAEPQDVFIDPCINNIELHVFKKNGALFLTSNPVKDHPQLQSSNLPFLKNTLYCFQSYLRQNDHSLNSKKLFLIIPVVEILRSHHRLLVFNDNSFYYYDSKNTIINHAANLYFSLVSASIDSFCEVEQPKKLSRADIAAFISSFCYKTACHYPEKLNVVKKICDEIFPKNNFLEIALGNQIYDENTNCGVYTALYAEKILLEGTPFFTSVVEDIIEARARLELYDDQKTLQNL